MKITTNDTEITLLEGETILDGLERTGHSVEFQCRSGYCGACRTTLEEGSVEYTTEPMAFLRKNEVLPCCSKPLEDISLNVGLMHIKKTRAASRHQREESAFGL